MKKGTLVIIGVTVVVASIATWDRVQLHGAVAGARAELDSIRQSSASLESRSKVLEVELAGVSERVAPIHLKCDALQQFVDSGIVDRTRIGRDLTALGRATDAHLASIEANRLRLAQVWGELGSDRARAIQSLADLQSELTQSLRDIERQVEDSQAQSEASALESRIATLPEGTIVPWLPNGSPPPEGWLECDGSAGTPDLRGLFLRGSTEGIAPGRTQPSSTMRLAGIHTHATDGNWNRYNVASATPRKVGDWLLLFDGGINVPGGSVQHGSHAHEDDQIPAHFTVVFIIKMPD